MDASERDGRDDFESFFRGVFPKAVAVAQRVTGDRPSAEDAALEALARTHFRWKRIGGQMVSGLLMQLGIAGRTGSSTYCRMRSGTTSRSRTSRRPGRPGTSMTGMRWRARGRKMGNGDRKAAGDSVSSSLTMGPALPGWPVRCAARCGYVPL